VVDSIRNPAEIHLLRNESNRFFVFGMYADKEKRWDRVKCPDKYHGDRERFDEDDENDTGKQSDEHGQRVGDCFLEADVVLSNSINFDAIGNEDFKAFAGNVMHYAGLVSTPLAKKAPLKPEEPLMAMAYAAGQRSSCLQRKVGAVIADGFGNVISSGFNEVPKGEQPCAARYLGCYRKKNRQAFFDGLSSAGVIVEGKQAEVERAFSEQFRILDVCRAVHAEENAILNLARTGRSVPLNECTLYTTTYPCRLCAKRIANLEFARIVYLEPYPDQEAKVILKGAGVVDEFFEGVTFRAYFRIYGEQR
jgi:deoxycytidylate deaminase